MTESQLVFCYTGDFGALSQLIFRVSKLVKSSDLLGNNRESQQLSLQSQP